MNQNQIVAQQVRYSEWAGMVRDRQESGLSVSEYCKQNNISETAYFYRLRRVRRAAIQASGLEFIELKDADKGSFSSIPVLPESGVSNDAFSAEATISVGALLISVNRTTPKELIQTLMEVAAHVK